MTGPMPGMAATSFSTIGSEALVNLYATVFFSFMRLNVVTRDYIRQTLFSNIQISHVQRVIHDEVSARLNLLAHQGNEHLLGLNGVGQFDAEQFAPDGIHRGLEKFLRVHFTQALEAIHLDALLADDLHAVEAEEMFVTLMGEEVEPRRNFIVDNALNVRNLDV